MNTKEMVGIPRTALGLAMVVSLWLMAAPRASAADSVPPLPAEVVRHPAAACAGAGRAPFRVLEDLRHRLVRFRRQLARGRALCARRGVCPELHGSPGRRRGREADAPSGLPGRGAARPL